MRAKVRMGSICLPAQESRNVELVLFRVRSGLPAKSIERLVRWALGVLGHRGHGSAGSSRNGRPRCSKPRRRGHSGTALGPLCRSGGWAYRPNVRSGFVGLFFLVAPAETHGRKPPQQAAFALLRMLCVRTFTAPPAQHRSPLLPVRTAPERPSALRDPPWAAAAQPASDRPGVSGSALQCALPEPRSIATRTLDRSRLRPPIPESRRRAPP